MTRRTSAHTRQCPVSTRCAVVCGGRHARRVAAHTSAFATQAGSFDLVVKVYPTGKVSAALAKLAVGDSIRVKGPKSAIKYRRWVCVMCPPALPERLCSRRGSVCPSMRSGKVQIGTGPVADVTSMVLVAGGSGITPMLQVHAVPFVHAAQRRLSCVRL